jgi:hypothetical protein
MQTSISELKEMHVLAFLHAFNFGNGDQGYGAPIAPAH